MIQRLDQGQDLPKIWILCALQLFAATGNNVGKETIVNCFRKAKVFAKNHVDALENSDVAFKALQVDAVKVRGDPFKALQENLTELWQSISDFLTSFLMN